MICFVYFGRIVVSAHVLYYLSNVLSVDPFLAKHIYHAGELVIYLCYHLLITGDW